jgi:TPR repeat protein
MEQNAQHFIDEYFAGAGWSEVQRNHGGAAACAALYTELFAHGQQNADTASWQCVLGALHTFGYGGAKKDDVLAAQWWQRAADLGHARARCSLGICYANGDGVEKNETRAAQLYQLAADQGFALARNQLGVCYRDGKGVLKDQTRAKQLFVLSSSQRDERAKKNLESFPPSQVL